MADVHVPDAAPLSDRAREVLRRAEQPGGRQDDVLDILQQAIDEARDHLMAIREMLETIAGERSTPPR